MSSITTVYQGQQYYINYEPILNVDESIVKISVSNKNDTFQQNEFVLSLDFEKQSAAIFNKVISASCNFVKKYEDSVTVAACFQSTLAVACFLQPELGATFPTYCFMQYPTLTEASVDCIKGVASALSDNVNAIPGFANQITEGAGLPTTFKDKLFDLIDGFCSNFEESLPIVPAPPYPGVIPLQPGSTTMPRPGAPGNEPSPPISNPGSGRGGLGSNGGDGDNNDNDPSSPPQLPPTQDPPPAPGGPPIHDHPIHLA